MCVRLGVVGGLLLIVASACKDEGTPAPPDTSEGTTAGTTDASAEAADADADGADADLGVSLGLQLTPRPGARVTSAQPTFRWELPRGNPPTTGARLEICDTHDCAAPRVALDVDAATTAYRPPEPLPAGLHFWRLRWATTALANTSATLAFTVPPVTTPADGGIDTSFEHRLDTDGDGYAELALAAPGLHAVYVYRGGPGGIDADHPDVALELHKPDLGRTLAAGDIDADGHSELFAGSSNGHAYVAPGWYAPSVLFEVETGWTGATSGATIAPLEGALGGYAIGSSKGETSVGVLFLYGLTRDPLSGGVQYPERAGLTFYEDPNVYPTESTSGFGATLVSAGDRDGDGYVELAIGAPRAGKVFFLGRAGLDRDALVLGDDASLALDCAGDVDGDGLADLIVGAPAAGAAYLVRGRADGGRAKDLTLVAPTPDTGFATSVAGAGDVNGDGYEDVLVGAPRAGDYFGAVYLYLGSAAGLSASPSQTIVGALGSGAGFGSAVAGVSDLDGDGRDDIAIGAPAAGASGLGAVVVYRGAAGGVDPTPWRTLLGQGGQFGAVIVGR